MSGVEELREVMALLDKATPGPWHVEHYANLQWKLRGPMLPRGGQRRCIANVGAKYAYENLELEAANEANARALAAAVNWLRAHAPALLERIAALEANLAECFRLAGADGDGGPDSLLAARAVEAVRDLRKDYDDACEEMHGPGGQGAGS